MVYHFEAQKFLHVCIPQHAEGRKKGRERERAQRKVEETKDTGEKQFGWVYTGRILQRKIEQKEKKKGVKRKKTWENTDSV